MSFMLTDVLRKIYLVYGCFLGMKEGKGKTTDCSFCHIYNGFVNNLVWTISQYFLLTLKEQWTQPAPHTYRVHCPNVWSLHLAVRNPISRSRSWRPFCPSHHPCAQVLQTPREPLLNQRSVHRLEQLLQPRYR